MWWVVQKLAERGVHIQAIGDLVYQLQIQHISGLTLEQCCDSVEHVLAKREVQHALLTGIALDQLAEQGQLPSPLQEIITGDESLYGVDEILALAITNVYGTIGLTNFGYLDKVKPGILAELDSHQGHVHTFLDDLIAGVAAAAAARLAHNYA